MTSWTHRLVDQLDFHWTNQLRPKLEGLTDDEYFWEPVSECWNLRRRGEQRTELVEGSGDLVIEFAFPEPTPPPVTTIAWRLSHLTVMCFGQRSASHFDGPSYDFFGYEYSPNSEQALAELDSTYARWLAGVASLDDAGLERPGGAAEPFPEASFAELVLHTTREAVHHGAEILLLRERYRRSA